MGASLVELKPPRTIFKTTVEPVGTTPVKSTGLVVLKPAGNNRKLGGETGALFRKGPFLGMPLFSLTLEERATCPISCANWNRCYGNGMPFAKRYKPGRTLERAITKDLRTLSAKHSQGFVVRLHVLGDFYSEAYVQYWQQALDKFKLLNIFGYTHREFGTPIGDAVTTLVVANRPRVSILRSDSTDPADPLAKAITIERGASASPGTVICPQQTGRTPTCLDCGLCMNSRTSVSFIDHSKGAH